MLELLNEGHQRSRLMGHHGEIRGHVQPADNTSDAASHYVQRGVGRWGKIKKNPGGNVKFGECVRLAVESESFGRKVPSLTSHP